MAKLDFKKELKVLYAPASHTFAVVDVPSFSFIMINGQGNPNTAPAYVEAVEALYAVAFGVKMRSKRELGKDYVVPPLEGLWWADDMSHFTTNLDKDAWLWTMMIMQPEWITGALIEEVSAQAARKKPLPALPLLRWETYHEGLAAQILHIGPYDAEGPILAELHQEWLPAHGYLENGKHHEIYLSDPRRVAPAKLRTILRQPIRARDR